MQVCPQPTWNGIYRVGVRWHLISSSRAFCFPGIDTTDSQSSPSDGFLPGHSWHWKYTAMIYKLMMMIVIMLSLKCLLQTKSPKLSHSPQPPSLGDPVEHLSETSGDSLEAMSEGDVPSPFARGSRTRASLPVVRSTNQTKERSLGKLQKTVSRTLFLWHVHVFILPTICLWTRLYKRWPCKTLLVYHCDSFPSLTISWDNWCIKKKDLFCLLF